MSNYLFNSEFLLRVAADLIPGHSYIHKFGFRDALPLNTPVDIWNFPDEDRYTFSTTADIDTISSDSAADTVDIRIIGLDVDWNEVVQVVTLEGQNKVVLDTPLIRVFRMQTVGAVSLAGEVFLYVDGAITLGKPDVTTTVRAYIDSTDNQTLMMIYAVPGDSTAFIYQLGSTLAGKANGSVVMDPSYRPFGGVFNLGDRFTIGGTGGDRDMIYPIPIVALGKTDLMVSADSDTINVAVSATADILIVKNSILVALA